LYILKKF